MTHSGSRYGLTLPILIRREMWHSRWNTLASVLVVTVTVALYVAIMDISVASVDTTRALMKDMGFNLRITPGASDPARLQALNFEDADMPESYVERLATAKLVLAQHFVGKLQHTTQINGCVAVLTGTLGQTTRLGTSKDPMLTSHTVPRGKVLLGAAVAKSLNKHAGESLTLLNREFEIDRVLAEYGAIPEDIRVFAHLHDVQELLGRPGRINAIDALACQCPADAKDIVDMVRGSIESILPDVRVEPYYSILLARHHQRVLMGRVQLAVMTGMLIAAAAALWGLTYQNVTARRHELGVLRALGFTETRILAMFLLKAALCATTAAVAGIALGRGISVYSGSEHGALASYTSLLLIPPATAFAAMTVSMPPVMRLLLRDTAEALGEDLP